MFPIRPRPCAPIPGRPRSRKPPHYWPLSLRFKDDYAAGVVYQAALRAELVERLGAELQAAFPGVDFNFSQYLEDNVSEAASGVKGENAIKLFGNSLEMVTDYAERIRKVLATVRGIDDQLDAIQRRLQAGKVLVNTEGAS